jgi:hypothetical protein
VPCKVRGREYLHLVKAAQGNRSLIGNNRGGTNGWVGRSAIVGIATRIQPSRCCAQTGVLRCTGGERARHSTHARG